MKIRYWRRRTDEHFSALSNETEEMAKIGQMCLGGGMCEDKRVVSSGRLAESTRARIRCDGNFRDM